MNDKHISQLETQLERLVEGVFTRLFRKAVSPHDLAVKLARSMEDNLRYQVGGDAEPVAPDEYVIRVHPDVQKALQKHPALTSTLSGHLVELATQSGYQVISEPTVRLLADINLSRSHVNIGAKHSHHSRDSTAAMRPIQSADAHPAPKAPQLIINGLRIVNLDESLMNIGRSDDNDIIIDDPYVSRHHLQVRLRFGAFTLFDVNSQGGTFVNNVRVTEHKLQPGDVIAIGKSKLIYTTADSRQSSAHTTQDLDPVDS